MSNCNPPNGVPVVNNPCEYLPQLRAALYALVTGSKTSEVRDGDRWQKYHQGNVAELRAEIRKLEQICNADGTPNNRPRAERAGPRRIAAPMRGVGPYR
jgi:hypothetical protein